MEELVRELAGEIVQVQRSLAEQAGLNVTDLMAMHFIRRGDVTPKTLADHVGLTTGATTILLNRLEARDFIVRHPHPTDRRGVIISLGAAAQDKEFMGLRQRLQGVNAKVFDTLSAEERRIVTRFMKDLLINTRDALGKIRAEGDGAGAAEKRN